MPTNSELWTGVIDRLCGEFMCLAIDLPGFGLTPNEPYRADYLESLADRIERLRIANGIERCTLWDTMPEPLSE